MKDNLLKKFIQFAYGNGIVLFLGLISSPITTRLINPNEMGKFSMFNTFSNLVLIVIMLGLDQSYVRYYFEENEENRPLLLRKCILLPAVLTIMLTIFMIIFYEPISNYIVGESSLSIIILMGIFIFVSIISRFSFLQVRMKQKATLYSNLNIMTKLINILFIILLYFIFNNNYLTLVMATVLSVIIVTISAIIIEKKEWFNKSTTKVNTKTKEIIKYGTPFIFSMAITWIFQSIDRISIKQFCGYSELGLYSGAMSIIALLNAVQGAFTTFWLPVAYDNYSKDPENKKFFITINQYISMAMIYISIGLIMSKDLVVLLLGQNYRDAIFIFPYLVFMPIMYTISETTFLGINFKKKTEKHIYIAIICALVNLIGNIILVPKLGAKGAAVSTGLSYVVFFIIRTYISNKYYKVEYKIKEIMLSILMTYILATYSSFYKFNVMVIILGMFSIVTTSYMYKDIIIELYKKLRKYYKNIKNKDKYNKEVS
ncbi:lipopolysaccharide biosynthesis protein [Terrisporobacter sp.]